MHHLHHNLLNTQYSSKTSTYILYIFNCRKGVCFGHSGLFNLTGASRTHPKNGKHIYLRRDKLNYFMILPTGVVLVTDWRGQLQWTSYKSLPQSALLLQTFAYHRFQHVVLLQQRDICYSSFTALQHEQSVHNHYQFMVHLHYDIRTSDILLWL